MNSLEPQIISKALHIIAASGAVLAVAVGFALFEEYKARKHKPDAVEQANVVMHDPPEEAAENATGAAEETVEHSDRAKSA